MHQFGFYTRTLQAIATSWSISKRECNRKDGNNNRNAALMWVDIQPNSSTISCPNTLRIPLLLDCRSHMLFGGPVFMAYTKIPVIRRKFTKPFRIQILSQTELIQHIHPVPAHLGWCTFKKIPCRRICFNRCTGCRAFHSFLCFLVTTSLAINPFWNGFRLQLWIYWRHPTTPPLFIQTRHYLRAPRAHFILLSLYVTSFKWSIETALEWTEPHQHINPKIMQ